PHDELNAHWQRMTECQQALDEAMERWLELSEL
ncbi:hypothetical protein, partial [Litorivivens sp.]